MITLNDNKIFNWLEDHGATILTWIGVAGVAVTAIVAAKDTRQAEQNRLDATVEKLKRLQAEHPPVTDVEVMPGVSVQQTVDEIDGIPYSEWMARHCRLTKKEAFELGVRSYIPTIGTVLATMACVIGANAMNQQRQAVLTASCMTLQRMLEEYREKVRIVAGQEGLDEVDRLVRQEVADIMEGMPPWDEKQTFYIEGQNCFFERTMQEVMEAEYHLNRNFILRGDAKLNELYEFLELQPNDYGNEHGWDEMSGECIYGYRWIDFRHRYFVTDDGITVCEIEMPFGPHSMHEFDEQMEKDLSDAEVRAEAQFHHPVQTVSEKGV